MPKPSIKNGFWVSGINSAVDPGYLAESSYQWGTNVLNRGGFIRTRPGFTEMLTPDPYFNEAQGWGGAQGAIVFTSKTGVSQMLVMISGGLWVADFPYTVWRPIAGGWDINQPVTFTPTMKSVYETASGYLEFLPEPYPLLFIHQSAGRRASSWDGLLHKYYDPTPINVAHGTPGGQAALWSNNRLWVAQGRRLRASNLADPEKFTEEDVLIEGGFFTLPSDITAIGETSDLRTMLVFTDTTTTAFQTSILTRDKWKETDGFQRTILPGLGCPALRGVANQWGYTWFYSHDGLVGLDNALQTYRSSRIHFRDQNMMRSKSNMWSDLRGICIGTFDNFLLVSVPSGHIHNAHTWVLDQGVVDSLDESAPPAWVSNWVGLNPIQWFSAVAHGEKRIFCISRDREPFAVGTELLFRVGLWEAFMGLRSETSTYGTTKRIKCDWESKLYGGSGDELLEFLHAAIHLINITGQIDGKVSVAGARSGYTQIAEFHYNSTMGIQIDEDVFKVRMPQSRILRTPQAPRADAGMNCVQSRFNVMTDYGFSLLIEWEGDMTIRGVKVFLKPMPEKEIGECPVTESTERFVFAGGEEKLTTLPIAPDPLALPNQKSRYSETVSSKYPELSYSSR